VNGAEPTSEFDYGRFIGRLDGRPWLLNREKYKPSAAELRQREYDETTEKNLRFVQGHQVAGDIIRGHQAAEQYMNRKAS
jgi:hypothetical protein